MLGAALQGGPLPASLSRIALSTVSAPTARFSSCSADIRAMPWATCLLNGTRAISLRRGASVGCRRSPSWLIAAHPRLRSADFYRSGSWSGPSVAALADAIGRVRVLILSIGSHALFTFLAACAQSSEQLL